MFRRILLFLFLTLGVLSAPLIAQATDTPLDMLTSLTALLTYAFSLVSSAILGAVKGFADKIDLKIANWIKPFQPLIVSVLTFVLPMLTNALGITDVIPADVLAATPLGTVIAVTARELLKRWQARNTPAFA